MSRYPWVQHGIVPFVLPCLLTRSSQTENLQDLVAECHVYPMGRVVLIQPLDARWKSIAASVHSIACAGHFLPLSGREAVVLQQRFLAKSAKRRSPVRQ